MRNASKERSARLLLLAAIAAGCLFVFRDYLLGERIMVYTDVGSDTLQQYIAQFTTVVNHLREGTFRFYDLNFGMGTNILCLNLFDPGFLLTAAAGLVLGTAHMLIYLVVVHILKILAAGWLFYLFLSEFSLSIPAKWAASFAYAFNGFLLIWGQHYQFGTPAVYLPLILLFTERFLRGKKSGVFLPVTVFLSAMLSVYFTYMTLIMAGFYTLFRMGMEEEMSLGEKVRKALGAYACMILGLGMGLGIFLPTARILLGVSERLDGADRSLGRLLRMCFSADKKAYYEVLGKRMVSSNLDSFVSLNGKVQYTGYKNYYEDPELFTSTLTVFLCLQYLTGLFRMRQVSRRRKVTGYLAAGLMALMTGLKMGSIVMNGFVPYTYRYLYVLLPAVLLCAAWTWDRIREGHPLSAAGLAAGIIFLAWGYREGFGNLSDKGLRLNLYCQIICSAVTTGVLLALLVRSRQKAGAGGKPLARAGTAGVLLGAAVIVSVLSDGRISYSERETLMKTDEGGQYFFHSMYSQDIQDALAYTRDSEKTPFRVEKDYSSGTFSMDGLIQGYRGISVYNSILNKNLKEFFSVCYPEWLIQNKLHILYRAMPGDGWAAAFLGIRYFLSEHEALDSNYFLTQARFNDVYVHKNKREAELGWFFTRAYSEASLKKYWSKETRQLLLGRGIALKDAPELKDLNELMEPKAYSGYDDYGIEGTFYDTYPGRREEVKTALREHASGSDSLLLPLPGEPVISDPDIGRVITDPIRYDDTITGTVEALQDGYVLFMIPYEEGWTLTVDGERAKLLRGDLGFLAWNAPSGSHTFRLHFTPPGLIPGMRAGMICWAVYLLWIVYIAVRASKGRVRAEK